MSSAATFTHVGADGVSGGVALYPVRKACGWCKCDMGEALFEYHKPGVITHGICDPCYANEIRAIKERRKVIAS
jgi:hypothetical protein